MTAPQHRFLRLLVPPQPRPPTLPTTPNRISHARQYPAHMPIAFRLDLAAVDKSSLAISTTRNVAGRYQPAQYKLVPSRLLHMTAPERGFVGPKLVNIRTAFSIHSRICGFGQVSQKNVAYSQAKIRNNNIAQINWLAVMG